MSHSIAVGEIQLTFVSGGRLRIDGGNMFGVIPRALWERKAPPDALNRIALETNCVLVRTHTSLGLIDTGYGDKSSPTFRKRHGLEELAPLPPNLAAVGVTPDQLDWVVLTHLHFDHAGGATYFDEGQRLRATFPRARHFVQRNEWTDAVADLPELAGSYYHDDFTPLDKAGLVELVDGPAEITHGVSVKLVGGHTRGHQVVYIKSGDASAVCLGDLCPTAAHLPTFWTMSYDQFPLEVRRNKPAVIRDIVEKERIALLSHDPNITAARLFSYIENDWKFTPLATG